MKAVPMQTSHIKVGYRPSNKLLGILAAFITLLITFSVLPDAWSQDLFWTGSAANPAVAGSGNWVESVPYLPPKSWSSTPGTTETGANWADGSVADFQGSNGGTATLNASVIVAGINFEAGANAFTILTHSNNLTITGPIVNGSGLSQTIENDLAGSITLSSAASGDNVTLINAVAGSSIIFSGAASGGNLTLINAAPTTLIDISQSGTGATVTVGSIEGNGTLELGANNLTVGGNQKNTVFSGVIQASFTLDFSLGGPFGSLTKVGTGTLTLSGANTYSGGTNFNGGILAVNIDGNLGTGPLSFNGGTLEALAAGGGIISSKAITLNIGGGTFLADAGTSSILNGTISGVGSLTKNGLGVLTLTGANTYSGPTTITGGNLIVDGSIASVQTLVNASGFLGGRGFLGGSLVNSGIVSPGDSPGTLTVNGNYTQNANGTLRVEVAGLGQGQFDLLAVGGHASLAGTLQLIRRGPFQLQVGDKLTFLTAKGGVSGSFSTVQNPFISNTIVKAQVVILPTAVELVGTQGSFVDAACDPNSAAVARALDNAVGDPRAAGLINFLNSEPFNKLCSDFTLIAPEELASIFNIGVSLANVQTANLERRMGDIRAGSTGFNAAGFTMNGSTPSFSAGLGGPTGAEGKAGPSVLAPIPENRWGIFATGLGEFTHVDSTNNASGFDLQTGGVTLGVDYRVCSHFAIGLIAGYAHTNADLVNNGNLDVNSGKFGLYATAFGSGLYLDTAVTGGISEYDSRRTALLGTASGSTDGGDLNVLVNGGYDWTKGSLSIGPTASFQYTYVSFDGFTESGSLAPLKLNDQHVDSIRSAFGLKASYDWKVGHVLVRPELRAAWQHEYGDSAYSIVANFANGAGSSFTVNGPKIGRDSLLLGAGVAVLWSDRISTYVYYDGEVGRTNYDSHNVSAGVRITF
jgi:outer membrane autotransporter protein